MRKSATNLRDSLLNHGFRFQFYEAVRRLRIQVAGSKSPDDGAQVIRFLGAARKQFPLGEVLSLAENQEAGTWELETAVFGLFGPVGTLPYHDLDQLAGRSGDPLLVDFLNLFNQRLMELLFETWRKGRPDISRESFLTKEDPRVDAFSKMGLAISGFGLETADRNPGYSRSVYASLCGSFSRPVRSEEGLCRTLSHLFGVGVRVRPFCLTRLAIPEHCQTVVSSQGRRNHNRLGSEVILGKTASDHHSRFEISVGPLNAEQFHAFSPWHPSSQLFRKLGQMIRSFAGSTLNFGIRLIVEKKAVTQATLGSSRVGYNCWLNSDSNQTDRDDPLFPTRRIDG